jgi:hypothetical protein
MRIGTLVICGMILTSHSFGSQKGIINDTESPHVKLKSINIGDCCYGKTRDIRNVSGPV